jgi:hypothetical protein
MTTPAKQTPSFLSLLREATTGAPEAITKVVDKSIELHNLGQLIQYYEITNPKLVFHIIESVKLAVTAKMEAEVEASRVGANTFHNIVAHAVAFSILIGAHLAKDKEL